MKKILFFSFCLFLSSKTFAQSDFVPAGGNAAANTGSITYTIGQIAVQNTSNGSKSILEGIQQPYEIQTVGVDEYQDITLEAVVFPNPTQHSVQLRISNYIIPDDGLNAQLYDANGKLLRIYTLNDLETLIDMEPYPTATYLLRVMEGDHLLKTFKVVKHNF